MTWYRRHKGWCPKHGRTIFVQKVPREKDLWGNPVRECRACRRERIITRSRSSRRNRGSRPSSDGPTTRLGPRGRTWID